MSIHFLIDGYNVINRVGSLKDLPTLKDARISLVKLIQSRLPKSGKKYQVTIVFDGRDDIDCLFSNQNKGPIKIIFSKGESADETIKRIVEGCANPREMVVVTDDKAIIFFTRSLGAKVMFIKEFLGQEQRQSYKKVLRQREQRDAGLVKIELTSQQQEVINEELKRFWK